MTRNYLRIDIHFELSDWNDYFFTIGKGRYYGCECPTCLAQPDANDDCVDLVGSLWAIRNEITE